ncbi:hypothetical protein [Paenibacillus chitinolyticus]|uniref:hypothetical protein n=1 Tax=Paenibacillus chitinolyticus TaxID=79263 RepID=UPI00364D4928
MINVSPELKVNLKQQRLRQIEAQYYEIKMNKTGFEANGKVEQAAEMENLLQELERAYQAISNMD